MVRLSDADRNRGRQIKQKAAETQQRNNQGPGRKALHCYLSDEALENWHAFAAEAGVSISALVEAMAPQLPKLTLGEPITGPPSGPLIIDARKIDAERRRRRG